MKQFPLKYYLKDIYDGRNLHINDITSDLIEIHAKGNWPSNMPEIQWMVHDIQQRAPELALYLNTKKHGNSLHNGGGRNFDPDYWCVIITDPVYDREMRMTNELRVRQGLAATCMYATNLPVHMES